MIRSIRHKGLKHLYDDDDPCGVKAEHVEKVRDIAGFTCPALSSRCLRRL